MKLWQNILIQVVATLGQSVNLFTSLVPDKYKPFVMLGFTLMQVVTGILAHESNPDGTSSKVAYTPPAPKVP